MQATGFYEQKSIRPGGLALVIALHAAAFAGLILVKTDIVRALDPGTDVILIPTSPPPPVDEPPPQRQQAQQPTVLTAPPTIVQTRPQGPAVTEDPPPQLPPVGNVGPTVIADASPDLPRIPVRLEAQLDSRSQLQPPYPPSMEAREIEGTVRIRVTIGTDGRVKAIERLSATNDAFWAATERHVRARWRFRPATEDGRPIESTKVMNLIFRIEA